MAARTFQLCRHVPSGDLYIITNESGSDVDLAGPLYAPDFVEGMRVVNPDWWRDHEGDDQQSIREDLAWADEQHWQLIATVAEI